MKEKAFAKVNLILSLGEKNQNGRFDIHFIMQEIDLHDEIKITARNDSNIFISCDDPSVPVDESNLCHKATLLMQEMAGTKNGIDINITKRIPPAGGLGGGSSDAATVIKSLLKLWKIDKTKDEIIEYINPHLGTDTSFFLKGKTSEVVDNGKKVISIKNRANLHYVLIKPEIEVPKNKTEHVYKHYEGGKQKISHQIEMMKRGLIGGEVEKIAKNIFNSFESSLPPFYNKIPDIRKELLEFGCLNSALCGAGPTLFGICKSEDQAASVLQKTKDRYPLVIATKGIS